MDSKSQITESINESIKDTNSTLGVKFDSSKVLDDIDALLSSWNSQL